MTDVDRTPAEAAEDFAAAVRGENAALDARIRRIVREEISAELRTGAIRKRVVRQLDDQLRGAIIEGEARLKAVS